MTIQTLTLTDFLLARIAEDEALARAVIDEPHGDGWFSIVDDAGYYHRAPSAFASSRDWPAFVLADVEAKRRIVKMVPDLLGVLAALALPYADHPDYREEWKP